MNVVASDRVRSIRALNDVLRATMTSGLVVTTSGVADMPAEQRVRLVQEVQAFDNFSEDNDPHGEHDFGSIKLDSETFFWKIDYYDNSLEIGSPDPADPNVTKRVLTIMKSDEY